MSGERTSLSDVKRSGGRSNDTIRPVSIARGILSRSHGSVQYKQGETCVIASVMGPLPVRRSEEIVDKAVVQVTFQRLQGPGTDMDTHLQYQLKHALAACVMTAQYPQTRISFVVQVVNNDGGLLAACLNAVYLCLLDSGIACHSFLSSVTLAIGNKGSIRVDPDKAEEAVCDSSVSLCFSGASGGDPQIVLSHTHGVATEQEYDTCLDVGLTAANALQTFLSSKWRD
jgi:exosome complex component RRP46